MDAFASYHGFEDYTPLALALLEETIGWLNTCMIPYTLISGTLLGHHGHFIPWDDDMDLLVNPTIVQHSPPLSSNLVMISFNDYYKIFFRHQGIPITRKNGAQYRWPYIDLFTFVQLPDKESKIQFFQKSWDEARMFPSQEAPFYHLTVSIPRDPHYFLSRNYGSDYQTKLVSSNWNHKKEEAISPQQTTTMDAYRIYVALHSYNI